MKKQSAGQITAVLWGKVMIGRGIDQVPPFPVAVPEQPVLA